MSKNKTDFFRIFLSIFGFTILRKVLEIWISENIALLISSFIVINLLFFIPPRDSWFHLKIGNSIKGLIILNLLIVIFYVMTSLLSELVFTIAVQVPEWISYVIFFFLLMIAVGYGFHLVEKTTQE